MSFFWFPTLWLKILDFVADKRKNFDNYFLAKQALDGDFFIVK